MDMFLLFDPSVIADKNLSYAVYSIAVLILLIAVYLWFFIKAGK